jgi:hypothetical protein
MHLLRHTREVADMAEDRAFRGLLSCLPTYLQRGGDSVRTTCGALIGGASSDQIRHTTWHTMLAALLPLGVHSGNEDPPD